MNNGLLLSVKAWQSGGAACAAHLMFIKHFTGINNIKCKEEGKNEHVSSPPTLPAPDTSSIIHIPLPYATTTPSGQVISGWGSTCRFIIIIITGRVHSSCSSIPALVLLPASLRVTVTPGNAPFLVVRESD